MLNRGCCPGMCKFWKICNLESVVYGGRRGLLFVFLVGLLSVLYVDRYVAHVILMGISCSHTRTQSDLHFLTLRAVSGAESGPLQDSGQFLRRDAQNWRLWPQPTIWRETRVRQPDLPLARPWVCACHPWVHPPHPNPPAPSYTRTHITLPEPFYLYGNLGSTAGIPQSTVIH